MKAARPQRLEECCDLAVCFQEAAALFVWFEGYQRVEASGPLRDVKGGPRKAPIDVESR